MRARRAMRRPIVLHRHLLEHELLHALLRVPGPVWRRRGPDGSVVAHGLPGDVPLNVPSPEEGRRKDDHENPASANALEAPPRLPRPMGLLILSRESEMAAPVPRWLTERLVLQDEIGSGGVAAVHLGRLLGPGGFARTVAIKRLHEQFVGDPEFVGMMLDEARLAARIQHPNVVATLDVVAFENELFIVLEHVQGETLARLMSAARRTESPPPADIAAGIMVGVLHGLHAAHEVTTDSGKHLDLVHRDVSPQNILVGADGLARVLDFGIAKAADRLTKTSQGKIKGKVAYMAPEQVYGHDVDRRADVFGASVVLWELLTTQRLFAADSSAESMARVVGAQIRPPSELVTSLPSTVDEVVLKGLARRPEARYPSALAMATAIESAVRIATPRAIAEWVTALAGEALRKRRDRDPPPLLRHRRPKRDPRGRRCAGGRARHRRPATGGARG